MNNNPRVLLFSIFGKKEIWCDSTFRLQVVFTFPTISKSIEHKYLESTRQTRKQLKEK